MTCDECGLYATDRISRSQHRGRIVYET